MEPPAKRLRLMQSVEVDDTDLDYVNAKRKQQQKLKDRFEAIFTKYGDMHESQSDVIDMRANKVVVDRGHLRRLVRQVNRDETILLDTLGLAVGEDSDERPEQDEDMSESEDELAPTQSPKSSKRPFRTHQRHAASTPVQSDVPRVLATTYQAAQLMQLVQFPQTPAGQQAQSTFYEKIDQAIKQAVQQTAVPLSSSLLSTAPGERLPLFANTLLVPATPIQNEDRVTPATDPKWFFPPLSHEPAKTAVLQSSPITVSNTTAALEGHAVLDEAGTLTTREHIYHPQVAPADLGSLTRPLTPATSHATEGPADAPRTPRRTSPRVRVQRKREGHIQKYHFTDEDDGYMIEYKQLHKRTLEDIRNSQAKWRGWPIHAFHNRWYQHLKGQSVRTQVPLRVPLRVQERSSEQPRSSPAHQMLTPTSLEREDTGHQGHSTEAMLNNLAPSSTQFDDDELELLSLAGADVREDEAQLPTAKEINAEDTYIPDAEEVILPSVEPIDFANEDCLQRNLLESSPTQGRLRNKISDAPVQVEAEPMISILVSKRRRMHAPLSSQTIPDSDSFEGDLEHIEANAAVAEAGSFLCDVCHATFKSAKNLRRHEDNPRSTHDNFRPKSPSIDLVGDDVFDPPVVATPHIKRKFSTPPAFSFLFSIPAPQSQSSTGLPSSGVKSSGLSRKAYRKQVKRSWTKKGTPGPRSLGKWKSFGTLPKKRAWGGDEESEDELAF